MKFVYKINAGYDGFTPDQIPMRLTSGKRLVLGWARYLDEVEKRDEVWLYFKGRRVEPGIYARGRITEVNSAKAQVLLRVDRYTINEHLIAGGGDTRLADLVRPAGRQVFVLPEALDLSGTCTLATDASSCEAKRCGRCALWLGLPRIDADEHLWPPYLTDEVKDFVPAYWVIPSRSFIAPKHIREDIRQTSEVFMRFKFGDDALVYPLSLAIATALKERGLRDFAAVVPIPLSPDKASLGEIDRAALLARSVAELIGARYLHALELTKPLSKRRFLLDGGDRHGFESAYYEALDISHAVNWASRILLIDDVCTRGSTLTVAYRRLRSACSATIFAATAGQMILKPVVADPKTLLAD